MTGEIIKEYLIALGAQVDAGSIGKFNQAVKGMSKGVLGVTAVAGAAALAVYKFVDSAIKTDKELDKTARELKKSKDEALAYTKALEAMGATQEEIAKDKSLQAEFDELYRTGLEIGRMPGAQEGMQNLRALGVEVNKIKVTFGYAIQWLGDTLGVYLAEPIRKLRGWLGDMRRKFVQYLPKIGDMVGKAGRVVTGIFGTAVKLGGDFLDLLAQMPDSLKMALGVGGGLLALVKMGPIGWVVMAIAGLLLLLEDYQAYQKAIAEGWTDQEIEDNIALPVLWDKISSEENQKGLEEWRKSVDEIGNTIDRIAKLLSGGEFKNWTDFVAELAGTSIKAAVGQINILETALKALLALLSGDKEAYLKAGYQQMYGRVTEESNARAADLDQEIESLNTEKARRGGLLAPDAQNRLDELSKERARTPTTESERRFVEQSGYLYDIPKDTLNKFGEIGTKGTWLEQRFGLSLGKKTEDAASKTPADDGRSMDALTESAADASGEIGEMGSSAKETANWFTKAKNAVSGFVGKISNFTLPSLIGGTAAAGTVPQNAQGGIYRQQQTVSISEGGREEAIIPLQRTKRSLGLLYQTMAKLGVAAAPGLASLRTGAENALHNASVGRQLSAAYARGGQGGNTTYQISAPANIHVSNPNPEAAGQAAVRAHEGIILRNMKGKTV